MDFQFGRNKSATLPWGGTAVAAYVGPAVAPPGRSFSAHKSRSVTFEPGSTQTSLNASVMVMGTDPRFKSKAAVAPLASFLPYICHESMPLLGPDATTLP